MIKQEKKKQEKKKFGSLNLVRHFSSAWTKNIVCENMIKPTKCYNFHKEKTYQQERMKPCIYVKFAIKIQITIWIKTSTNQLNSTSS